MVRENSDNAGGEEESGVAMGRRVDGQTGASHNQLFAGHIHDLFTPLTHMFRSMLCAMQVTFTVGENGEGAGGEEEGVAMCGGCRVYTPGVLSCVFLCTLTLTPTLKPKP